MNPAPAPFPWKQAMAIGFGQLGLSPKTFWSMTPRELAAALSSIYGDAPGPALTQTGLQEMMGQFPD